MSIDLLNLGSAPDDGTGQDLRSGGQVINDNFAELDTRTASAQAAADAAERVLVAGANIQIDRTDPDHPVISASGGSTGTVQTVAGIAPDVAGDIPVVELSSALGVDSKVDKEEGKGLSSNDFTIAEKTKLAGVADNATANATNAQLRDRATHTGTQLAATISDMAAAVRAVTASGLVLADAAITSADSILMALGKAQGQINQKLGLTAKAADSSLLDGQNATFYTKVMVGATASVAGVKGLVPAPAAGDHDKFLCGDGTFKAIEGSSVWGGITGSLSAQTDLQVAINAKLNANLADFTFIYPNGGSAITPATAALNAQYIESNPFLGFNVITKLEVRIADGSWHSCEPSVLGNGNPTGAACGQVGDTIVVRTCLSYLIYNSGGYVNSTAPGTVTLGALPCRVKVWKVKA